MIIGIWFFIVVCIVIVLGETRYRCFNKKEVLKENQVISKTWEDNIDTDMGDLSAEHQVIDIQTFSTLRQEEYSKIL